MSVKRTAQAIAEKSHEYGLSPVLGLIAELAIPALIKCMFKDSPAVPQETRAAEVKKLAEGAWIPQLEKYRPDVLRRMRPATHRASLEANQVYSRREVDAASAAILDRARLEDVTEVLAEVATIDLSQIPDTPEE